MSTTERITDPATIDRLSSGLNRCFQTFEPEPGVFADDAFFDLYPPLWRFQLRGPQAFATQLQAIAEGPSEATILDVVPTATGFVMEHEEVQHVDGSTVMARRLFRCAVRDDLITDVVCFCNGGWDEALRERHAAEAPMLRPWETAR
jgi:hypothetical protein